MIPASPWWCWVPALKCRRPTDLARWARTAHPALGVVLLRRNCAAGDLREALLAGVREVVDDRDPAALTVAVRRTRAISRAMRSEHAATGRAITGRAITVLSPRDGVGTTSLAINLAAALAQGGRRRVCLVDVALASGGVAAALGLAPARSLGDLVAGGRLDDVAGMAMPYAAGLDVVLASPQPGASEAVPAELTGRVLRLLRDDYDHVVVHTPPGFDDHVLAALDVTDVLLLSATLDIPALKALQVAMETLGLLGYPRERQRIVLMRNGKAGLLLSEVEKSLVMPVWRELPRLPDIAASGGIPIVLADPEDPVSRALHRFAGECFTGRQRESAPVARTRRRERPVATLGMRLRAHAEHTAHMFALNTHLDIDDQPARLAAACAKGVLRLGYEAITCAGRHAGANNLWLTVRVTGPVVVRVEDGGTAPVCKRQDSYQWRTLNDIANHNNVYLAIGPRDDRGTIIEITAA